VDKLPQPIEWLSDNGSPYIAGDTRTLARYIGLVPCTTPIQSPQSTDVIDKDFLAVAAVCSASAQATSWRRAGMG
jgi:transposase InsO family protein